MVNGEVWHGKNVDVRVEFDALAWMFETRFSHAFDVVFAIYF